MSRIDRETKETRVSAVVAPGGGSIRVETREPFLTHMVETLASYAGVGLHLRAEGDLRHHLIEDVATTLGLALADELPENAARYGWASVPMDDAWVEAAVDVGGRPWYEGRLPSALYEHFLRSLAFNLSATLHVRVIRGRDRHHVVEAAFKATGLALAQALRPAEGGQVFSTKGSVRMKRRSTTGRSPSRADAPADRARPGSARSGVARGGAGEAGGADAGAGTDDGA